MGGIDKINWNETILAANAMNLSFELDYIVEISVNQTFCPFSTIVMLVKVQL